MFGSPVRKSARLFLLAACGSLIFAAGCFTFLNVEPSAPPLVDLQEYQPVAVLPAADAPGFAHSGALLLAASREFLQAKRFSVADPDRVTRALWDLNRDAEDVARSAALLRRFGETLRSRTVLLATISDYRRQKSYISPGTSQVWQGAAYEYQSLPTYHQGVCEMKLSLKLLDPQKATAVWKAEGRGRGPTGSEERILRQLVEDLLKDLPLLPEKKE